MTHSCQAQLHVDPLSGRLNPRAAEGTEKHGFESRFVDIVPVCREVLSDEGGHIKLIAVSVVCVIALGACPVTAQDSTSHSVQFVTVQPGVKVEVVDFGGPSTVTER